MVRVVGFAIMVNCLAEGRCRCGANIVALEVQLLPPNQLRLPHPPLLGGDNAEYLIVAFGSCARIGQKALELAREQGIKVGLLRPITLWPFPTAPIAKYADKVKGMLSLELNAGQMIEDIKLAVNGKVKVEHFGRLGGIVPDPDEVVTALKEKLIK